MCFNYIPFFISDIVIMASVKALKEIEKGKIIAAQIIRAGEQMLDSMNSLEKKLLNEKIDYSTKKMI